MKILLAFITFLLPFSPAAWAQKPPVNIIFDTDIGPDYDDVGAMALLHAMADSGECRILATIASNRSPYAAPVLQALNTYFGRPKIPVGVVALPAQQITAKQKWDSLVAARYPHKLNSNDQADDALGLYRRILAAAPDSSVTIVTVGFFTNMARLLQSPGDKLSPLSGTALVEKKVKRLVSMAGCFDYRMGDFREFNVKMDSVASCVVFEQWPGPVLFSGFEIGASIFTGLPIINNPSINNSPVKDVFATSIPMDPQDKNGRMSWDETAVLVAVRGYQPYFDVVPGKIICRKNGANDWDRNGHRDLYLLAKLPPAEMAATINQLIMHQPGKK